MLLPHSMLQSWEIKGKVVVVLCSVYLDVRVRKAGRRRRGGIRLPETASVEKLEGAEE